VNQPIVLVITEGYHTVMITDMYRRAKNLEGNIAKYTRDIDGVSLWVFFPRPHYNSDNVLMRNITSDLFYSKPTHALLFNTHPYSHLKH
jgi:hypothetical protein